MGKISAAFRQQAFRGRLDDVGLNSATFNGGGGLNGNWSQPLNANFRIRIVVEETAGGAENVTWALYYSHNGGAYAEVNGSTPIHVLDSPHFADDAATTTIMSGTGTFLGGYGSDVDARAPNAGNQAWSGNQYTELEFCLDLNSATVAVGDTFALRIRKSSGATITYNQTPTITATAGAVNVNVAATRQALTLATLAATVRLDTNVGAGVRALSLATHAASVVQSIEVAATSVALTLTEQPATVRFDTNVAAGVDALTLAEQAATISYDVAVQAATDALTLSEQAATVALNVDVAATTDAMTLTGQPATVASSVNIAAATTALTLAEHPAVVGVSGQVDVAAGTDALTLTEYTASVNAEINVAAGIDALTLTEQPATVTIAASGTEVNATVASLVMATHPATVGVPDPVSQTIYFHNPLRIRAEKRAENDERETRSLSRRKALKKVRRIFRIVAEREPELAAEIVGLPVGNLTAALTDNLVVQDRLINDVRALRELYLAYYARQDMEDEDIAALLLAM